MSTNYSLLFYLKKPKNYADGDKPIYMRITVAGEPKEVSTGRDCDPVRWNAKANRAKGTKEDIRNLNAYLDTLERQVADAHLQLVQDGAEITAETLKLKYLGKDVQRRYLMETFTEHNRKMEALLGKGFKPNTLKGYNTSVTHLTSYWKNAMVKRTSTSGTSTMRSSQAMSFSSAMIWDAVRCRRPST